MAKIKIVPTDDQGNVQYHFWCEGCGYEHAFETQVHAFNGDINNPIVSPSILHTSPKCHCMIYNGRIRYFSDSHHHLRGRDGELLDVDQMVETRRQQKHN